MQGTQKAAPLISTLCVEKKNYRQIDALANMPKRTAIKNKNQSWREFEKLVALIERVLAPQEAVVKSPDHIEDAITNETREVDASIRYKVGSTEILIIIECRNRKHIQDTLWIEQVHSKQNALRAAKCIVVSSSGFTKPAIKKATMYGIEIRNLKKINQEVIKNWAPLRTWFYNYKLGPIDPSWGDYNYSSLDAELDKKINDELGVKFYIEDPCLKHDKSDKIISLDEYIRDTINLSFSELKADERLKIETNKELILSFCGVPEYFVECSLGKKYLVGIAFVIIFYSIHDYSITPITAFEYSDENVSLVKGMEFNSLSLRENITKKFSLHTDLTSQPKKIAIWEIGKKS